jgi:hypothetical protein
MSRLRERTASATRPLPDEVILPEGGEPRGRAPEMLRTLGAVAVLVVGAVHLEQYLAGYSAVSVIGPLFLLNFVGATVIGVGLLIPAARLRALHALLALAGIGLAATSFVFLFVSEHRSLFGFQEHGYRGAIVAALVAEAAAVVALAAYLAVQPRRRLAG